MTTVARETLPIPDSHLDLLMRPLCGVLTTIGVDGQPQSSLVWVDTDAGYPSEQQGRDTRMICCIHARRITLDAIHA